MRVVMVFVVLALSGCLGGSEAPNDPEALVAKDMEPAKRLPISTFPEMGFRCGGELISRLGGPCYATPSGLPEAPGLLDGSHALAIDPEDGKTMLFVGAAFYAVPHAPTTNVVTPRDILLWRSEDGGLSWVPQQIHIGEMISGDPSDDSGDWLLPRLHFGPNGSVDLVVRAFAGPWGNGLHHLSSSDRGQSWTYGGAVAGTEYHWPAWIGRWNGTLHILASPTVILQNHPFHLHSVQGNDVRTESFAGCEPGRETDYGPVFDNMKDGRLGIACGTPVDVGLIHSATLDLESGTLQDRGPRLPGCGAMASGRLGDFMYTIGDFMSQAGETSTWGVPCGHGVVNGGEIDARWEIQLHSNSQLLHNTVASNGVTDPWGGSIFFSQHANPTHPGTVQLVNPALFLHRLTWDGSELGLNTVQLLGAPADAVKPIMNLSGIGASGPCEAAYADDTALIACVVFGSPKLFVWQPAAP